MEKKELPEEIQIKKVQKAQEIVNQLNKQQNKTATE